MASVATVDEPSALRGTDVRLAGFRATGAAATGITSVRSAREAGLGVNSSESSTPALSASAGREGAVELNASWSNEDKKSPSGVTARRTAGDRFPESRIGVAGREGGVGEKAAIDRCGDDGHPRAGV